MSQFTREYARLWRAAAAIVDGKNERLTARGCRQLIPEPDAGAVRDFRVICTAPSRFSDAIVVALAGGLLADFALRMVRYRRWR